MSGRDDRPRPSATGRVVLVGAGPGDPDLITVRGAAALRDAEVVLFDELAADALLDLAPAGAERVNVGKRGHGPPSYSQEDIHALMIERARAGKQVVRLKGGDPFVFGRGGEEVSACRAAGVVVEVVPGVSSATAALSAAGIPVTDRRHSASFAVVTGHKDPTRVSEATRWIQLGSAVDTLVILMGIANLSQLVAKLIEGGRPPETPAAAIMNGTRPDQRVVEAALVDLPERVKAAGIEAPAAVVVGEVVSLRRELAWIEERPLRGHGVLVTRPEEQASEMLQAIELAGGEALLRPMIELALPEDCTALDHAIETLPCYDLVVFVSANSVRFLTERARAIGRGDQLTELSAKVVCVGSQTARAASDAGLSPEPSATGRGDGEALLAGLRQTLSLSDARVLVPRSELGRAVLPDGLRAAGARVDELVVYRNTRPELDSQELCAKLTSGGVDVLTFASPSAVRNFAAALDQGARRAAGRCTIAAIGETTAAALENEGFAVTVMPRRHDGFELVAAVVEHLRAGAHAEHVPSHDGR